MDLDERKRFTASMTGDGEIDSSTADGEAIEVDPAESKATPDEGDGAKPSSGGCEAILKSIMVGAFAFVVPDGSSAAAIAKIEKINNDINQSKSARTGQLYELRRPRVRAETPEGVLIPSTSFYFGDAKTLEYTYDVPGAAPGRFTRVRFKLARTDTDHDVYRLEVYATVFGDESINTRITEIFEANTKAQCALLLRSMSLKEYITDTQSENALGPDGIRQVLSRITVAEPHKAQVVTEKLVNAKHVNALERR
jgi:hypothetical protein